jgi:hypothetical protein
VRSHPLSRFNSTVNGGDVRGPQWDEWWNNAQWSKAVVDHSFGMHYLHVPCPDTPAWDGAVYRVRCKSNDAANVERCFHVDCGGCATGWHWCYPRARARA